MSLYYYSIFMPSLKHKEAWAKPTSTIYAVEGVKGNDGSLNRLLDLMDNDGLKFYKSKENGVLQGRSGLIAEHDVVIIKVNSQWDERGMTNTDLVKSIISAIFAHPNGFKGEIIIADNGQAQYGSTGHGGSFEYKLNNAEDRSQSVQKIADYFSDVGKISTYLWDEITQNEVLEYSEGNMEDGYVLSEKVDSHTGVMSSYPKFKTIHGTFVSFKKGIWNSFKNRYEDKRLKVINTPILKSHFIFGVTGAMKHYMGIPSDKLTTKHGYSTHQTVGKGGMGTLMAETRIPTISILDAININAKPGSGPKTPFNDATYAGIVATSLDPIALDYWASKNILCVIGKTRYNVDVSRFNPDNTTKGCFGDWLKLATAELNDAGYPFTVDEERIIVKIVEQNPRLCNN